jgi:hypothetical protein
MSDPPREKRSIKSRLQPIKNLFPKLRSRSRPPSPQLTQSASVSQQATAPLASLSLPISTLAPLGTSPRNASPPTATQALTAPVATPSSGNLIPQDNVYTAIGGLPATVVPKTPVQRAKAEGSTFYEGLKTVLQGLYDCSDMFLPLKTAAGGLLTIIKAVDVCGSVYP